jgi:hypothetical protein
VQPTEWVALAVAAVALGVAVVALVQTRRAYQRLAEVTPDVRGLAQRVHGQSAEEALSAIFQQLAATGQRMGQLEAQMTELERVVVRAIRRVGLVRYDASDEIHGELSFALCLLDNRDNGIILTSNYTLEGCRVFVRGVLGGKVRHELLEEEAQALQQALNEP